jgi:hypothetical protein
MKATYQKDCSEKALCCYINDTSQIQIGRIANLSDSYFERVIFPQQRLLFEAPPFAELEIYTGELASAILQERIPGDRLRVALGN